MEYIDAQNKMKYLRVWQEVFIEESNRLKSTPVSLLGRADRTGCSEAN